MKSSSLFDNHFTDWAVSPAPHNYLGVICGFVHVADLAVFLGFIATDPTNLGLKIHIFLDRVSHYVILVDLELTM